MVLVEINTSPECQAENPQGCNYRDDGRYCRHSAVKGREDLCSEEIRLARTVEEEALAGSLAAIMDVLGW